MCTCQPHAPQVDATALHSLLNMLAKVFASAAVMVLAPWHRDAVWAAKTVLYAWPLGIDKTFDSIAVGHKIIVEGG